ncbi:MAG: hypothetical protein V1862_06595 [Methanobacteriota archaeon]
MSIWLLGAFLTTFLLSGVCMADEAPGYQIYLQGSDSTLTEGANNMTVLTINDTIPYAVYLLNKSFVRPIDTILPTINGSINAAIVISGVDGETTSIVQVSNPVYSAGTNVLMLDVEPLTYYEGTVLKNFSDEEQNMTPDKIGKVVMTRVYLENHQKAPENTGICPGNYDYCI